MLSVIRSVGFCIMTALAATAAPAADPFAEYVRSTEPLAPEEEAKTFKLPEGFSIQLVAAEPEIGKPMNMEFDARGRLWVTESREYPFAAPLDKPGATRSRCSKIPTATAAPTRSRPSPTG